MTAVEVTFEQYMATPETVQPAEVVDGILRYLPTPSYRTRAVACQVGLMIDRYVEAHDLGVAIILPIDLIIRKLPKLGIRQPDVSYSTNARAGFRALDDLDRLQDEAIAPSLVVDVLLPGQDEMTLAGELADYASILVEEVWLVDQDGRSIRVLARDGDGYRLAGEFGEGDRLASAVLPGIDLDVAAVFGR